MKLRRFILRSARWAGLAGAISAAAFARGDDLPAMPPARHPGGGQVIYFVMTDRFANGSASNDRGGIAREGAHEHGFDPTRVNFFHGGDFEGLTTRLDYIAGLGVTGLWITPPFRNKVVQGSFGSKSAGYHGYWIRDFLSVDPHLGTLDELREFVGAAHALGIRVYCDIVVNHTADVIVPSGGGGYVSKLSFRYRDAEGNVFDDREFAANGIVNPAFPAMSAVTSFPRAPVVPSGEPPKNPAWLNDLTNYHNRGDSSFSGEDFNYGDIAGLDDLFTEKAEVLAGFIDIYRYWIESVGFDGFRIDTVKHVNPEFWQGFSPAIRQIAASNGSDGFLQFGEVFNGDPRYLSQWCTAAAIDTVLDFGLAFSMRDYVSRGGSADTLYRLFEQDDLYTDHDSDASSLVTFLGNHDLGRFGYFLREDNAQAPDERLLDLAELGYGLLFCARGQPVLYYGDEQGMTGTGGDTGAREDMFATQTTAYRDLRRIGTSARGDVDKFDESHPLYRMIASLSALRAGHEALRSGAMWLRPAGNDRLFAFSRIDRETLTEYLVVANNSRSGRVAASVPTSQPGGGSFRRVFDSASPEDPGDAILIADADGRVMVELDPLQFAVWRAENRLGVGVPIASVTLTLPGLSGSLITVRNETTEGQSFASRTVVEATLSPQPDYAEVTFAMQRESRPGTFEIIGVDDAPPYRVYWRPPADLPEGERFRLVALARDLRGHQAEASIEGLAHAKEDGVNPGVQGSRAPAFSVVPAGREVEAGESIRLVVAADGLPAPSVRWLFEGGEIPGADAPALTLKRMETTDTGGYVARVRNVAATAVHVPAEVLVSSPAHPLILHPPGSVTVPPGEAFTLAVEAVGAGDLSYQWFKDGLPVTGATDAALTVETAELSHAGRYAVKVTGPEGFVESRPAYVTVAAPVAGRLVNLSVRSRAGSGEETLIAGFVVEGTGGGAALIRGVGPGLNTFGVPGVLEDPEVVVFGPAGGDALAMNDDWGGVETLAAAFERVGAFSLDPEGRDAALRLPLEPGAYTMHVRGRAGAAGVALAEIYDDAPAGEARLVNLSSRSLVGNAAQALIAGFSVAGNVPRRVLIRGIGPALQSFGVDGALEDATIRLFRDGETVVFAENDDWSGEETLAAAFAEAGAFPLAPGSLDAAIVDVLAAGAYTVHLEGFAGETGVGLIEIYELP